MPISSFCLTKKDLFFISFILVIALFFRFEYMEDYRNSSIYPVLEYSDSYSFLLWAKDISSGDFGLSSSFMKWPLYAYFLGFLFKVSRDNVALVYFIQYILGAFNCVLVYFIGKKIFNETVGFISGLFCAWYGLFVFYDSLLVYTCLSLFLNSLLFLFILNIKDAPNKKNLFWIGVFLGICAIAQANIAVFGVFAILWVLKKSGFGIGKILYNFFFFILGSAIVIGSVALRNYIAEKDFVLIAGNVGFNFYSGNNPESKGVFYCPPNVSLNQEDMFRDSRIIANSGSGRELNTQEVSDFWFNKSIGFIRKEPLNYLRLFFKKMILEFAPGEFVHDIEYHFISGKAKIFNIMFMDLRFILPAAFLGMFLGLKKLRENALLYIALITLSISIAAFFVTARYRIVIVPYLAIFSGFGIFNVWTAFKSKKFLKFSLLCASLLALFFLLNSASEYLKNTVSTNSKDIFDYHFTKALDYKNNSDYSNALRELGLANKEQADNLSAVLQAGVIYFGLNDLNSSEVEFKKALKINPLSADAYYNLGLIYNKQKRLSEAKDTLRQAISLDPENAAAHFELGLVCKSLNDPACAKEEFGIALKKINRWRGSEISMIKKELSALGK